MHERTDSILSLDTEPAAPPCPRCGKDLAPDAVLCCHCGFHRGLGYALDTDVETSLPWTTRRAPAIDFARGTRSAYLVPLGIFLVAGGLLVAIKLIFWGPEAAASTMMSWCVGIPFGLVAYWICAALWIGHDAPIGLTILRLAAVYAAADLALAAIPMPFVGWPLSLFVYVGLLADQLELDLPDAAAVALVTIAGKFLFLLVLIAWVMSQG